MTPAQTGAAVAEKLAAVRAELRKAGATALAVPQLDCLAWLLDLRARDLPCTPLAVAFAFLTLDTCTLFIAPGRLREADAAALAESGVALRGYDEFLPFLRRKSHFQRHGNDLPLLRHAYRARLLKSTRSPFGRPRLSFAGLLPSRRKSADPVF